MTAIPKSLVCKRYIENIEGPMKVAIRPIALGISTIVNNENENAATITAIGEE